MFMLPLALISVCFGAAPINAATPSPQPPSSPMSKEFIIQHLKTQVPSDVLSKAQSTFAQLPKLIAQLSLDTMVDGRDRIGDPTYPEACKLAGAFMVQHPDIAKDQLMLGTMIMLGVSLIPECKLPIVALFEVLGSLYPPEEAECHLKSIRKYGCVKPGQWKKKQAMLALQAQWSPSSSDSDMQ